MNRHFRWIVLVSWMLLLVGCTSIPFGKPQPSPTPGPLDLVKAFITANNSGDIEAVMALFDQANPTVHETDFGYVIGLDQVRKLREFHIGKKTNYQLTDCKVEIENTVNCTGTLTDATLDAVKFPPLKMSSVTFHLKDNHISMFETQVEPFPPNIQEISNRFVEWTQNNYPKEYRVIMVGPVQALTREDGERFVEIAKEFAKTLP